MESANRWSHLTVDNENEVRVAKHTDAEAITRLLRNAPYSHVHADWHYPGDWLGHRSFVVLPEFETVEHGKGITSRFFSSKSPLLACLAVTADPKPAAWVRLAAVANKAKGPEMMASMFAAVADPLRQENVTQIAWLLVEDWPETWLPDLGFEHINEVITFSKLGTDIPRFTKPLNMEVKPVQAADLAALAKIEARAFDPLWRHSEMGLALAKQQTLSFDVAWIDNQPVAFQFSSSTLIGAHLSRITVDPSMQQSGVGSALLAHALEGYDRMGISNITLNTQLDNVASQHFYERFGFRETGERFPVWSIELDQVFQQ